MNDAQQATGEATTGERLREVVAERGPVSTTPKKMSLQEAPDFYAKPENQEPQGPARRRRGRLTDGAEVVLVLPPPVLLSTGGGDRDQEAFQVIQRRLGGGVGERRVHQVEGVLGPGVLDVHDGDAGCLQ